MQVTKTFFHGNNFSKNVTKHYYFQCKITFQITTKRFNMPLFQTEYGFLYWQHLLKICHLFFYIYIFFHFPVYEIDIGDWTFMFQGVNAQYRKKRKPVKQIDFIQKLKPQKKYSTY